MTTKIREPLDFALEELIRQEAELTRLRGEKQMLCSVVNQLMDARRGGDRPKIAAAVGTLAREVPARFTEIAREACNLGAEGYRVTGVKLQGSWFGRQVTILAEPAGEVPEK